MQRYATLSLSDVYSVLAYYLRHSGDVEEYLARREQKAEEVLRRIEGNQNDLTAIRARLVARRKRETEAC